MTGTIVGGGTLTLNGTAVKASPVGLLQLQNIGTMELTGPVSNAATTTFTDDLTPTGTYVVKHSVVDVSFQDIDETLIIDDIAHFFGTVTAVNPGDQFVIAGGTLSNLDANGNNLTVSDSGGGRGSDQIMFNSAVDPTQFFIVNGNTIQVACFAEGTRIETETGPVAVEDLMIGDRLVTDDGTREPIVWIGQRTVNCAAHPQPESVWPVRVRAGAFGENVPERDLYLSPDHAVFVNDVLVPVKLLINGTTIAQVSETPRALLPCGTTAPRGDPGRGPAGGELPRHRRPRELPQWRRNDPAVPRLRRAPRPGNRAAVGDGRSRAFGAEGSGTGSREAHGRYGVARCRGSNRKVRRTATAR